MDTQIICPSCRKPIPISEALSHQMKEQLQKELAKLQQDKEEYRAKMMMAFKQRVDEERNKIEKAQEEKMHEHDEQLKAKLSKQLDLQMKDKLNETEELRKTNQALQQQLLETNKLLRQIKSEKDQMNIEMQKKLLEEEEKIRQEARKQADEQHNLKIAEQNKQMADMAKQIDELKRKAEQGSQQTQGEVLEDQVGEILRREFPIDMIQDVPKGKLGADLIQTVMNMSGQKCGMIVWELKRTKTWMHEWIPKLKDDQRKLNAIHAVIISEILPTDIKVFGFKDGVWIGNYQCIRGLAHALRRSILEVVGAKNASTGKEEKMEVMWEYLTSVEFKQKVEAIIEVFASMEEDIEKEQTWFARKWEKQRKNMRRVIDNTAGMYGSLESIMGKALPEVNGLSLPDENVTEVEEVEKKTLF